jgi:uncharacterized damage-inducible protein DinB
MVFESVEQIYSFIDKQREKLIQTVSDLSNEQAASRRAPDAWSIAEIAEHLSITEKRMLGLFNKLLEKAESEGLVNENNGIIAPPISLTEQAEQAKTQKFTAPEHLIPNQAATISASLESLKASRASVHQLRTRIESADVSKMRFPHPAFGPLNLYQWLAFIGLHEAHHLRQIKETLNMNTSEANKRLEYRL